MEKILLIQNPSKDKVSILSNRVVFLVGSILSMGVNLGFTLINLVVILINSIPNFSIFLLLLLFFFLDHKNTLTSISSSPS